MFEVTRDRFVVLNGANQFKSVFVTRYVEPEPVKEEAKVEEVKQDVQAKPKKRGRKKKEALEDERDKSAQ